MHQKIVHTQQKIKEAFVQIINEKGIERITVKDITDLAHINRSTFYKHFHDKDALIKYYEQMILDNLLNYFLKDIELYPDKPNIYRVVKQVINYVDQEFALSKALLGPNGDPNFEKKIYKILIAAINDDVLRLSLNHKLNPLIPNEYIYEIIIAPLIAIIKHWLAKEEPESPEEIFNIIMKMRFLSPYDLLNIQYQA